jgi:hypothetical protein
VTITKEKTVTLPGTTVTKSFTVTKDCYPVTVTKDCYPTTVTVTKDGYPVTVTKTAACTSTKGYGY